MTKYILLLAFVMLPFLSHSAIFYVEAAGGGGGPTQTLIDEFTSDATDWTARGGTTCGYTTDLEQNNTGSCVYTGSSHGDQPSTEDHWVLIEFSDWQSLSGVTARNKTTDPGAGEFNYVARCQGTTMQIRLADDEQGGTLMEQLASGCANKGAGDRLGFLVHGEGDSTDELAVYFWDVSVDTLPSDWGDPATWGDADLYAGASATPSLLADYTNCGGGTTCSIWDCAPDTCDGGSLGYPPTTHTWTGTHKAHTSTTDIDSYRAGDL